ncbi:MAG: SGNH/GDSL hydrolase family protein [Gemmatimonadetes bacterium]|nr:SGNH/GDSL hydrolase family protein [Gemmatimonadota bacterium]
MSKRIYHRYVAIGDSSTEGLDDPDGQGGYRGWANRLAEHLATAQGHLLYANLGVRGKRTREILEHQLEPALALKPDLVTVFSGTNDVVARRFDVQEVSADLETLHRAFTGRGVTVLTFTLPDLTPVMPLARWVRARVFALNDSIRAVCASSGAVLVDVARHPVASDPRLWSDDRLHANSTGHARIAAALAQALGLPGADPDWAAPLPARAPTSLTGWLSAELAWCRRHFLPWMGRHLVGRSSGDGLSAKRPVLAPLLEDPRRARQESNLRPTA